MKAKIFLILLTIALSACSSQKNLDLKSPCLATYSLSERIKCERHPIPGNQTEMIRQLNLKYSY